MIKLIKNSLTLKIFLITCGILVTVCAFIYLIIIFFVPNTYSTILSEDLKMDSLNLSEVLADHHLEETGGILTQFSAINLVSITILDEFGAPAAIPNYIDSYAFAKDNYTAENWDADFLLTSDGVYSNIAERSAQSYPVTFLDSDDQYMMLIIGSVQIVNEAAKTLFRIMPVIILTVILVSLLVSWLYSLYITRPIIHISRTSEKMLQLDFHTDSYIKRDDEIGQLSENLNALNKKLGDTLYELKSTNLSLQEEIRLKQGAENRRLAFFSAVSHDLKTPITIVRGQLEGMLLGVGVYRDHEKYLMRSLEVMDRMERLVQELLMLSHLESPGFTLNTDDIDIRTLISVCVDAYDELLTRKGFDVKLRIEDGLVIRANLNLLRKVLNNLLENAVKYSPESSSITITANSSDEQVVISVENSGVTISEHDMKRIFSAFYRVEQSRNRGTGGNGLGLYIVKTILELHHATFQIVNTNVGVRFTFEIARQ